MLNDLADLFQKRLGDRRKLFAIYSLDEWRREFVWKRHADLAEEALALFYQAKDAISSIRSPVGYAGEGNPDRQNLMRTPRTKRPYHAFSLIERYNRHSDLFARIQALRYRFMAQHGLEAAAPFDELIAAVNQLIPAAKRKARLVTRRARRSAETNQVRLEEFERQRNQIDSVFYEWEEEDPISPRIDAAVAAIERTCRGIIESRGTLFSLINSKLPWPPKR